MESGHATLIQLEAITPITEALLVTAVIDEMRAVVEADATAGGRSRVLRYGWSYTEPSKWVADIPPWLVALLPEETKGSFDNVSINEYRLGTGIVPHIDAPAFGGPVLILSLNSCATMLLHPPYGAKPLKLFMPARSLVTLTGRFRTDWKHSITASRHDTDVLGVRRDRQVRYSVVMRKKS
jgi:alkylated DNA repair dioxygenase AlkB